MIKPQGNIHHCIGCFGCWVKTPGKCVIHDGYEGTGIEMSKCTELILISQCCYGSVSPFVKMVQDRAISYIHPDFELRKGEMHHKRRYQNVIETSAYFYAQAYPEKASYPEEVFLPELEGSRGEGHFLPHREDITAMERETARKIIAANADNYDGRVKKICFYQTAKELERIIL